MRIVLKQWFVFFFLVSGCMISVNTWADSAKPKTGEWKGSPSVSFTVKDDGKMSDFTIAVPLAMGECNLTIPQIAVTEKGDIELVHPQNYFSINGIFKTPTSIEGKVTIKICPDPEDKNNTVMLVPWEKEWNADLK